MSSKIKIATIVGARPQFIKAAIVSQSFGKHPDCEEFYIHTGQHYDDNMSADFFRELSIPEPRYHLKIGSGSHGAQTGRMMIELESVLMSEKPNWVLIYGDTNSTLAGAIVAAKLMIPIAHVEAGERSFEYGQPEEINRIIADRLSSLCFTCTETARHHLLAEGVADHMVHPVGDVMLDAALFYGARDQTAQSILQRLSLHDKGYGLVTFHRPVNTDFEETLSEILKAVDAISSNIFPLVFPVHPRTKAAIQKYAAPLWDQISKNSNLRITEPLGYFDILNLTRSAALIITDSGGLQKEAYFHRTPCVILRENTEWVDLVKLGWNHLVHPITAQSIVTTCKNVLASPVPPTKDIFGDGHAADKIVSTILAAPLPANKHKR